MAARLSSRMALVARATSISTGAIVGATIGSVVGATIIFLCALPFILRARRRRAFRKEHGDDAAIEDFPGSPDFLSRSHIGDAFRRLSHSTPAQPPPKASDGQESTDQNTEPAFEKQQTTLYPTGISVQYGLPSPLSPAQSATARFDPLPGRALHDGRTATGSLTLATQTTQDSIPTQTLSQDPTITTETETSFKGHSISDSFASPSRKGTFESKGNVTDEPDSLGRPGHKRRSSHLSDSVRHLAQRASAALRRDSTLSAGSSLRSPPLAPNDDFPQVASAPAVFEPVDTEARGEAYSYYHGFEPEPAPASTPAPLQTTSYGPPISIPTLASAPPRSAFTSPTSASTVTPISPISPVGPSPLTSRPTFGLGMDGVDNMYAEPEDFNPSLREKRNADTSLKRMDTQPLKPIENDIPSPPLPAKSDDSVNPMDIWAPTTAREKDHQTKQELVKLSTPSPHILPEATPPLSAVPAQPTPDATPEPDYAQEDHMDMYNEEPEYEVKQEPSPLNQGQSPYVAMPPPQIAIGGDDIDMAGGASGRYTPPASIPSYPTTPAGYPSDSRLTPGPPMATPSNDGSYNPHDSSPKVYKCGGCNREFDQYHKLNHHTRYHDRPHICTHYGCDKRFGTKTHLERHINDKHTKAKKYHCTQPDCHFSRQGGKSFPRKDNLRRHMQNKHNINDPAELVVEESNDHGDLVAEDSNDANDAVLDDTWDQREVQQQVQQAQYQQQQQQQPYQQQYPQFQQGGQLYQQYHQQGQQYQQPQGGYVQAPVGIGRGEQGSGPGSGMWTDWKPR